MFGLSYEQAFVQGTDEEQQNKEVKDQSSQEIDKSKLEKEGEK